MMEKNKLSGIERELVLQYLIDGNVPVTLTPIDDTIDSNSEVIKSLTSQIFPVAIKGENIQVSKEGVINLENPPQSVVKFANRNVKVEFYFNRVGLYFISKVSESKEGLTLSIPNEIDRIVDVVEEKQYDFSALIYFDCKSKKDLKINCFPTDDIELFTRPAWKIIPLENQKKAKELLEEFVSQAKIEKNAGNGLLLIPVCKYLTENHIEAMEAMENRQKPMTVLFVDHERIVLGLNKNSFSFVSGSEYGIKLSFAIKAGPILSRDIFVTGIVNKIYSVDQSDYACVDLKYTTMQEEDMRFLYEKATSTLFN